MVLPYHASEGWSLLKGQSNRANRLAEIALTSREEALLYLLLNAMKRLSTRDLVEEFCAFRVWPLSRGWHVELGAPKFDLSTLTVLD